MTEIEKRMNDERYSMHGVRILHCAADGPLLNSDRDALDVIGSAHSARAELVVIPVSRLGDAFFALKTRVAGEILQKFVNYNLRLAILGDINRHLEASDALRDFVYETNRRRQVWFLPDKASLEARLGEH